MLLSRPISHFPLTPAIKKQSTAKNVGWDAFQQHFNKCKIYGLIDGRGQFPKINNVDKDEDINKEQKRVI